MSSTIVTTNGVQVLSPAPTGAGGALLLGDIASLAQRTTTLEGMNVVSAQVNTSGHLVLTLSAGTTLDAGGVVGPAGSKGDQGTPGIQGVPGPQGFPGVVSASGTAPLSLTLAGTALSGSVAAATHTTPGIMAAADKAKIDTYPNTYSVPTTPTLDQVAAAGATTTKGITVGTLAVSGPVTLNNGAAGTDLQVGSSAPGSIGGTIGLGDMPNAISKSNGSGLYIQPFAVNGPIQTSGGYADQGGGPTYVFNQQSAQPVVIGSNTTPYGGQAIIDMARPTTFRSDVTVDGTSNLDQGNITTDGNGVITCQGFNVGANTQFLTNGQVDIGAGQFMDPAPNQLFDVKLGGYNGMALNGPIQFGGGAQITDDGNGGVVIYDSQGNYYQFNYGAMFINGNFVAGNPDNG